MYNTQLGESCCDAVCNEPHLQGDAKYCLMCQSVKENFAIIKIWPGLPGWRCLVWVLWSFRVILPLCVNLSLLSFWSIFMWTSNKWCPPFFLSKLSDCGIMPLACIKKWIHRCQESNSQLKKETAMNSTTTWRLHKGLRNGCIGKLFSGT